MRGARLHRSDLGRHEVVHLRGATVTSPLRTSLDVARTDPLENGVAIVDAFLRARLLTLEEFVGAAGGWRGPGRVRLQQVANLIDAQSGSILESLTRVLLWRHGLLPTATQLWIGTNSWSGRVDFAWPERHVVLETDGFEFHASRSAFESDRRRWNELRRAGWRVGVVTWLDVTTDPAYVVGLVRDLLDNGHTTGTAVA